MSYRVHKLCTRPLVSRWYMHGTIKLNRKKRKSLPSRHRQQSHNGAFIYPTNHNQAMEYRCSAINSGGKIYSWPRWERSLVKPQQFVTNQLFQEATHSEPQSTCFLGCRVLNHMLCTRYALQLLGRSLLIRCLSLIMLREKSIYHWGGGWLNAPSRVMTLLQK